MKQLRTDGLARRFTQKNNYFKIINTCKNQLTTIIPLTIC